MKFFDTTLGTRLYGRAVRAAQSAATALGDREDAARIRKGIKRVLAAALPVLFSLLLTGRALPLSTCPLGLSLLAAARGETLYFALGGFLLCFIKGEFPTAAALLAILVFRFIFSKVFTYDSPLSVKQNLLEALQKGKKPFCESETLRLATSALGAFTAGMLRTVAGGFSIGDLVGTCFCVLLCPALTYLYTGYFSATERSGFRYEAGFFALLVSLIYALSDLRPLGISLSVLFASWTCFLLAKRKSPYAACCFGLLSVLAAEPLLSPAFAVAAALAALAYARSALYAVGFGMISFAAVSYLSGGLSLFASSFPECMAGAILSIPISGELSERIFPYFLGVHNVKKGADAEIFTYKHQNGRASVQDISDAFASLSETFFDLSDKNTRIGIFDTRQICDRVLDRHCRHCAAVSLCWERDYAVTLDTLNKISARLYTTGKVQKSDLPSPFLSRCQNHEKILADIEAENRRAIGAMLRGDKTRAFAVDYAVFARVLSEALQKNEREYAPNKEACEQVKKALSSIGFSADSLGVYGARCKNVYAFRLGKSALKCKAEQIKETLEKTLGGRMEDPIFEFADGGINMICHPAPCMQVHASVASLAGNRGEENGDRVRTFDSKNGYFYALVGDGMGSGRAAAKKSEAAAIFLEKMLRAGNSIASGIEMLSALARADGEEGFTTLDLFELDTITGRGSFIKSGAAPSFVRRGAKLFKIRSKTFPIGILEDVDAERTSFSCEDGDTVVMLSDGVTEEIEEPLWLCTLLSEMDLSAPDAAEKILAEAKKHTLGRDDMTAAVISLQAK